MLKLHEPQGSVCMCVLYWWELLGSLVLIVFLAFGQCSFVICNFPMHTYIHTNMHTHTHTHKAWNTKLSLLCFSQREAVRVFSLTLTLLLLSFFLCFCLLGLCEYRKENESKTQKARQRLRAAEA